MKKILVLGAGRSSGALIKRLATKSKSGEWTLTVADLSIELVQNKIRGFQHVCAEAFNVESEDSLQKLVQCADVVISLLPPSLHILVARACLKEGRNLVTASYLSNDLRNMDR